MDLQVQKRDKFGSELKELRKAGLIPAELYGHGIENVHLSVPIKDFRTAYKTAGENTVVNLRFDSESRPVLIHEVTKNSLTDEILSIDFYQVNMNEEIQAAVPIKFVGESPAVKNLGGILVKPMSELKVKALPADLPSEITIDLSALENLHQSIYVKDIKTDGKYKIVVDGENVLVTVSEQKEEEVVPTAAPDLSAIKTEGDEKKAEREAEKTAATEPAK